jgi:predicted nucleotidyltransferase
LGLLADQGLVLVRRDPRADAFEFNRAHVLTIKLIAWFNWERQLREEFVAFLRREINRRTHAVSAAYLFGSTVSGEMAAASDIDVAVVCPPGRGQEVEAAMERVAAAVRDRFGNHLSAMIRSSPIAPFDDSGGKGSRLWTRILKEGIPIVETGRISAVPSARTRSGNG